MQYAIIENGVVANIVEANGPLPGLHMIPASGAGIGYLFDGVAFSAPIPTAQEIAEQAAAAKEQTDRIAAKADAKVAALGEMTPAQVRAWVAANVANLADAKDVIATLAVAVSVLARRI